MLKCSQFPSQCQELGGWYTHFGHIQLWIRKRVFQNKPGIPLRLQLGLDFKTTSRQPSSFAGIIMCGCKARGCLWTGGFNVLFSGCTSGSFLYPVNVDFFPALMATALCEALSYSQEVHSATKWNMSRNEKAVNNYLFHFHCRPRRFCSK